MSNPLEVLSSCWWSSHSGDRRMAWLGHYILQGRTPILCDDFLEWGLWLEANDRRVAFTKIGRCTISTVFLGLNHRFNEDGPPLLFETMVFDPKKEQPLWRFTTWEEAEAGHQAMVQLVKLDREARNKKAFKQLLKRLEGTNSIPQIQ